MIKFITIFFACAYLLPFLAILARNGLSVGTFVPLLLILCFYVGILPHLLASTTHRIRENPPVYNVNLIRLRTIAWLLLGLYLALRLDFLYRILSQGGPTKILSIMQSASEARYQDGTSESASILFQGGSIIYFCMMGVVGILLANNFRLRWIAIAGAIVLIEMMEGSRARALIGMTLLLTEFIVASNSKLLLKSFRSYLKTFALLALIAALIFVVPQYARVHHLDNAIEIVFLNKLPSYTIAMHEALAIWADERNLFLMDFGYNTFAGALKLIGLTFPQGFYEFSETSLGPTNVYTNMRNILSDFGIFFSPIIYYLAGHLIGSASIKKRSPTVLIVTKAVLIFVLFPIYSPFIFFNVTAGIIALWVLYIFVLRDNRHRVPPPSKA